MEDRKLRQFNFRLSEREIANIKALAKYFGLSSPEMIRLCIQKTIEKLEEKDPNWNKKHTPDHIYDKRKEML